MVIIEWVKRNKLATFLLFVIGYFLFKFGFGVNVLSVSRPQYESGVMNLGAAKSSISLPSVGGGVSDYDRSLSYAPSVAPSETKSRMVIQDTTMSMMVKDVSETIKGIEALATKYGGYMVDSYLSKPEGAANGSITVRVLSDKRQAAMEEFKRLGVKTIMENVSGTDVTDQYEDLGAQLIVYEKTKAKFEEIMAQAIGVQDLMSVQRELINVQNQIDSVKGRQKYLEQTAKLTKITAYLSTDELALPYAPDVAWRPALVFKQAVRSFIGTVRSLGNGIIWLAVYTPVWLPLLLVWIVWKKRQSLRKVVAGNVIKNTQL